MQLNSVQADVVVLAIKAQINKGDVQKEGPYFNKFVGNWLILQSDYHTTK